MSTVNYTSLLGLALPTQGDLSGQWGTEVNNYITTYLDSAVAGQLAISLTGNLTLTKTTGSSLGSTSSQYAILNVTPSASTWTITVPAASKTYYINNLSSSFTFTIKASGQTGFVVAAAEKCVVAYNGTDFVRVGSTSVFGAPSTAMTIDTSGNVGLGVTPSAWGTGTAFQGSGGSLWFRAAANGVNLVYNYAFYTGTNNYLENGYASRYTQVSGQHQWFNAPSGTAGNAITFTQAMTLDASGNLGLGVTPSAWSQGRGIELLNPGFGIWNGSGTPSSTYMLANTYYNSGFKYAGTGPASHYYQYLGGHIWSTAPSGTAGNAITFTQAMALDSSGNLLVGTTTDVATDSNSFIFNPTTKQIAILHATGTSSGQNYINFLYAAGSIGSITQSGTAAIAYNTSSDYRLKNSIAPMTGALAKVDALKPVTYKWNADGSDGEGFIAHELAEVCPHAVTGEKDAVNEDGSIKSQGIDTSFLVATLTAALQEAHSLIKDLQTRVTQLEAK
jgi:hypothetical protein